jgi:hypothetical protein
MSISCSPSDLALAAKQFRGLPPEVRQAIDTYLLAVIAGGSTDPKVLARQAECFCLPPNVTRNVQAYLLCQAVNGGGGGGCDYQDMQVAWTPTNVKLGEVAGFIMVGQAGGGPLGVSTVSFDGVSVGKLEVAGTTDVTSIAAPNLTAIDPGGYLTSDGGAQITGNTVLTSVSLPLLSTIHYAQFQCSSNSALTSLSLPELTEVAAFMEVKNNPLMTSFSAPNWVPEPDASSDFSGNAFPAAVVNAILHQHVLSATWGNDGEELFLNGGTNAAPSGVGIADKATLILRGATVSTN